MREKTLRNIAVICSIVGLIMLFLISRNLELESKPTNIGEITVDDIGENVRICGEITSKFVSKKGNIFLRLMDETGGIPVVIFENTAEKLKRYKIDAYEINKGDEICITGDVDEWEDKIEVKCKKIELR